VCKRNYKFGAANAAKRECHCKIQTYEVCTSVFRNDIYAERVEHPS